MKSNFEFLNRYWPALAQIGHAAENYVYSDPNASLYKTGLFAERLVQEIMLFEHISEPITDNKIRSQEFPVATGLHEPNGEIIGHGKKGFRFFH